MPHPPTHARWWPILSGFVIIAAATMASALALLPALLIGFVLLLRDVLGPTALPFGVVISILSWLSPDWGSRAVALSALLRGFDAGLAAHLVRPIGLSICALAPAAAIVAPLHRLSRFGALFWRLAALLAAGVAAWLAGPLVTWLLTPALALLLLRTLQHAQAPPQSGRHENPV